MPEVSGELSEAGGLHMSQLGCATPGDELAAILQSHRLAKSARKLSIEEDPRTVPSAPPSPPPAYCPDQTSRQPSEEGAALAALLNSESVDAVTLTNAISAVLAMGDAAIASFRANFGPRRLIRRLSLGLQAKDTEADQESLAEMADVMLAACVAPVAETARPAGAVGGMAGGAIVGEDLHREELYPDIRLELNRPMEPSDTRNGDVDCNVPSLRLRLPLPGACAIFHPSSCTFSVCACGEAEADIDGSLAGDAAVASNGQNSAAALKADGPSHVALVLRNLSRRATFGSEIECKVWPASVLLGRCLYNTPWLARGRKVLEIGAGVGAAGLAAGLCGASQVLLTDINGKAIHVAHENCALNAKALAAVSSCVGAAHLDWAAPPIIEVDVALGSIGECESGISRPNILLGDEDSEVIERASPSPKELLRCKADIILAADVVNAEGLSEMVERMLSLYLAPDGLFLMVAPRPRHRHCIEVLRGLLQSSTEFSTEIVPVPDWLSQGIEEASDIEHELYIVQRQLQM